MGLVHMYPFLPDALEYLELIAEQQGLRDAPVDPPDTMLTADWDTLLAYCTKITATDYFDHVPLRGFTEHATAAGRNPTNTELNQAAPLLNAHSSPSHVMVSRKANSSGNQTSGQRAVHFSPEPVLQQAVFSNSISQSVSHSMSGSQSPEQAAMSVSQGQQHQNHHSNLLGPEVESQAMQSYQRSKQTSRQGSGQIRDEVLPLQTPALIAQRQPAQYTPLQMGQGLSPTPAAFHNGQQRMPGRSLLQLQDQVPGHLDSLSQQQLPAHRSPVLDPQVLGHTDLSHHQLPVQTLHHQQSLSQVPMPGSGGSVHKGGLQGQSNLPSWIGQNLASKYAEAPAQVAPRRYSQSLSPISQPLDLKVLYPTAAMRSQQLLHQAPSASVVQAPLAPFLNEQLKRMVAQGGPSARRGF